MTSNLSATKPAPNFAIIEDELEPIHARLVQIPTHSEMLPSRSRGRADADTINLDCIACKRTASHWPCTDQS